jgi:acetylornithine deacetylase/succinyl-diaminopimelate desuccinylase-like protein
MAEVNCIGQYIEGHLDESLQELVRLCTQPSVSAQNWGLVECSNLVADLFHKRGFHVETWQTGGAPAVFAERNGKSNKTLIFYNHYDVQPAEPLELWDSPPFEPTFRNGKLYARGVSDDKGHITSRLFALDALLACESELPCNVKFLIEGEEEAGSNLLENLVQTNKEKLSADACIWEFGGVDHREVPMQTLGLRGICYVELTVDTATQDVHSGIGGSIFPNSAWRLIWALSTLKGPDELIKLPGFYDSVRPPSARDRQLMAELPEIASEYKKRYGISSFLKGIEAGAELRIAEVFEPTCTICGLTSGYQGPGSKTVLPAHASAKVDFRLVPDQTPEQVLKALRSHLDDHGFQDVQITDLGSELPARTDPDDPFIKLVMEAASNIYEHSMQIVPMSGGSGPNYAFVHHLHVPIASSGVGYPGAQSHAPNENLRPDLYAKGAMHIAQILKAFGRG